MTTWPTYTESWRRRPWARHAHPGVLLRADGPGRGRHEHQPRPGEHHHKVQGDRQGHGHHRGRGPHVRRRQHHGGRRVGRGVKFEKNDKKLPFPAKNDRESFEKKYMVKTVLFLYGTFKSDILLGYFCCKT